MSVWKSRQAEFDAVNGRRLDRFAGVRLTRRQVLGAAVLGVGGVSAAFSSAGGVGAAPDLCRGDLAIDDATAQLFCGEAPLVPADGLRDARAVWAHVPGRPERSVLIYLHGHNGYVTVDAAGRSRMPDWAARDESARKGASAKRAAPLVYGLDRLGARLAGQEPIVIVPEDSTLATGSFWAKEPAGQYADPARLGSLVADSLEHLACLRRHDGRTYLPEGFAGFRTRPTAEPGPAPRPALDRVYLCGHSGAGLPLEEAAGSALILPDHGTAADLWLFDCTYWSKIARFVRFCERWKASNRLAGGRREAARFVCIYRPRHPDRDHRRRPAQRNRTNPRCRAQVAGRGPLTRQFREGGRARAQDLGRFVPPHPSATRRDPHLLHPGPAPDVGEVNPSAPVLSILAPLQPESIPRDRSAAHIWCCPKATPGVSGRSNASPPAWRRV